MSNNIETSADASLNGVGERRFSWKSVLIAVYEDISSHRVLAIAAGITFYSILAVFPALAALVSIYGLFSSPGDINTQLNGVADVLPGGAVDVIRDQMLRITSQPNSALGLTFGISLVIALWSANAGTKAVFDALNVVCDTDEKRNFFKLNAITLLFTLGGLIFILIAIAALIALPIGLNALGLNSYSDIALRLARWPLLLLAVAFAVSCLYRYGPNRHVHEHRWITVGGCAAALTWLAGSIAFSTYATHFGNYNQTYGSLGAIMGFMMWIWLSAIVLLMGAELDMEIDRQMTR